MAILSVGFEGIPHIEITTFSPKTQLCNLIAWWMQGNYILLTFAQLLGIYAFAIAILARNKVKAWIPVIIIVAMYFVPLEVGRYASCWPSNTEQGAAAQNEPVEALEDITAEELLLYPERPLKTPLN